MTQFNIRKDLPIPDTKPKHPCYMLPFETMEIGDCLELSVADLLCVKAATAKCSNLKRYEGKIFTKRTCRDEGVVRIWRIK